MRKNEETDSPRLDAIFDALAHQKRRSMVKALSYRPSTIGQLATEFDLSWQMARKHLEVLEEAALILRRKSGRTNFVSLRTATLRELQDWVNKFHTEWGSDEATLENYIAFMTDEEPDDG